MTVSANASGTRRGTARCVATDDEVGARAVVVDISSPDSARIPTLSATAGDVDPPHRSGKDCGHHALMAAFLALIGGFGITAKNWLASRRRAVAPIARCGPAIARVF
jgi:hypothetical protein